MVKKLLFPVVFAVLAFFAAPMLGPEVNGATTFFLVAIAVGLGVMLNILLFKKPKNENKSN
ncbi:MAG: hypothetical protein AB7V48_11545 [Sedimentibacter sp.]